MRICEFGESSFETREVGAEEAHKGFISEWEFLLYVNWSPAKLFCYANSTTSSATTKRNVTQCKRKLKEVETQQSSQFDAHLGIFSVFFIRQLDDNLQTETFKMKTNKFSSHCTTEHKKNSSELLKKKELNFSKVWMWNYANTVPEHAELFLSRGLTFSNKKKKKNANKKENFLISSKKTLKFFKLMHKVFFWLSCLFRELIKDGGFRFAPAFKCADAAVEIMQSLLAERMETACLPSPLNTSLSLSIGWIGTRGCWLKW